MTSNPTTLFDIPENVFRTELFPCLRVNDLLRLRRVCRWTKGPAEDYLRLHPRSQATLILHSGRRWYSQTGDAHSGTDKSFAFFSMADFMKEHKNKSIRMPISRLIVTEYPNTFFEDPLITKFLKKYSNQIQHVAVHGNLKFPLEPSALHFYGNLPKLKSFRATGITGLESDEWGLLQPKSATLPVSLKTLTTLDIQNCPRKNWSTWLGVVAFCVNLEHIVIPCWNHYAFPKVMQHLQTILGRKEHKKLKCLDIGSLYSVRGDAFRSLCELCQEYDLKVSNFRFSNFPNTRLNDHEVCGCVLSIQFPLRLDKPFPPVHMPNAKSAEGIMFKGIDPLECLQVSLKSIALPALRNLKLEFHELPPSLTTIWEKLATLENIELIFVYRQEGRDVGDNPVFFGSNVEDPSFLHLVKLKKLTLTIRDQNFTGLTDSVFSRVLRHLKLRELFLISKEPIKSLTGDGIRALLDPTFPFVTSVEIFPFDRWTLEGVGEDEFQKLAKQFPCNRF